jgi:hypothetical protein
MQMDYDLELAQDEVASEIEQQVKPRDAAAA